MDQKSRRRLRTIAGLCAAATAIPLALLFPGQATKRQKAPFLGRNFAHRGLHSRDKSIPENSLPAFEAAVRAGYGMELDVQLSKDGEVVVFHDDTLDRVCGVHARVDELTLAELRELRLCGTDCGIPLFSEVLRTVKGRTPLIVELKTGRRNRELCEKTYALLAEYRGEACIESFNPLIVMWFRIHAHDMLRGQLAAPMKEYREQSRLQAFLLSHCLLNTLARPHFIAYKIGYRPPTVRLAERLGAMRVGWTSHEPKNERRRDVVIFEFYRPKVKFK